MRSESEGGSNVFGGLVPGPGAWQQLSPSTPQGLSYPVALANGQDQDSRLRSAARQEGERVRDLQWGVSHCKFCSVWTRAGRRQSLAFQSCFSLLLNCRG